MKRKRKIWITVLFIRTRRKNETSFSREEFSQRRASSTSIFRSVFQQRYIWTAQLGTVKGTQKYISRTVDYLRINRLFVSYGERGNVETRNFQLFHKAAWPIRSQLQQNNSPELSWSRVHTN